jgi:hypothetical protein
MGKAKEFTMNTNTNTTAFLLIAAREAYSTLRRDKGARATAVLAFLNAESDEQRDEAIWDQGGEGYLRRGFREAAIMFEAKGDQETANVFWDLRDMITENGFDSEVVEVDDDVLVAA